MPTTLRTLVTSQINTDLTGSGSACDQNNDQKARYCVVAGAGLTLQTGVKLSANGGKPLVLLSTGALELAGSIDVGSHQDGIPQLRGAGANPPAAGSCSFAVPPIRAAMGGRRCRCQLRHLGRRRRRRGMSPVVVSTAAAGGAGGGAIALVAVLEIRVSATINASGGGGHGSVAGAANGGGGGGGGGSSGMIVFDSSQPLALGAGVKLWANGGGGQGSSNGTDGGTGGESGDPVTSALGARARYRRPRRRWLGRNHARRQGHERDRRWYGRRRWWRVHSCARAHRPCAISPPSSDPWASLGGAVVANDVASTPRPARCRGGS